MPDILTIPANPIAQYIRTVVLVTDTTPPLFISLITSSVGVPVNPVITISNPEIKDVNPSTILNPWIIAPKTTVNKLVPNIVGIVGHFLTEPNITNANGKSNIMLKLNIVFSWSIISCTDSGLTKSPDAPNPTNKYTTIATNAAGTVV